MPHIQPLPQYVALGDSYSAGQFIGGDTNLVREPVDGGLGGPDGDYSGRSKDSYPQQLARTVLSAYEFIDVTCGGATIDDRGLGLGGILTPQTVFGGPPYVPVDGSGVPQFTPTPRPAQIDALSKATTLVTIGIGGNQYNLGQIIAKCASLGASAIGSPGTDYYRHTEEGRADLARKEEDLRDGFAKMMPELRERAPHARFFFVGYPTLFPAAEGQGTCDGGLDENITIKKGDMPFIQQQFDLVDSVIRDAAKAHGHTYVDIAESTRAHHVCREGTEKWMFGLYARYTFDEELRGYKPARFPAGKDMPPFSPGWTAWMQGMLAHGDGIFRGNETLTTFHPNKRGADNQARQVTSALRAAGIV
ncbi:SGNH/GDSL hydrolase family protein [Streptomyces sp. NPDC096136]|uniref:SGNH/GDSL hydrolase family protein n=1 Tax=Streptomyces sp. NPDC096136 TaxID=3366076 RepID=UPI0038045179